MPRMKRSMHMLMVVWVMKVPVNELGTREPYPQQWASEGKSQKSETFAHGKKAKMAKASPHMEANTMLRMLVRYGHVPFSKMRRYWKSSDSLTNDAARVRVPLST